MKKAANLMLQPQLKLFCPDVDDVSGANSSTFTRNLALPLHRWFRYSAGFSAEWVRDVILREKVSGRQHVLDPFAGSGTVLLEAELCEVESAGCETHPFVARVAQAKLAWRQSPAAFREHAMFVLEDAKKRRGDPIRYPSLIQKCYSPEGLARLDTLRQAWEASSGESPLAQLTWLALAGILRECSPVGTAQWQYVLPAKSKSRVVDPYAAFASKVVGMAGDMAVRQYYPHGPVASLHVDDARVCSPLPDGWADLVLTSPPYANNYDYADATRLEMSFFGEVSGWGDLQAKVRQHLVRSCTQHVSSMESETSTWLKSPLLDPICPAIVEICGALQAEREHHGGKKTYHTMIAAYFLDLAQVMVALRRVVARGGLMCFVVGDSAPYGVHVPVDTWLGELALAAGFERFLFEKTRDRNIKLKNRKHRVPLREGRLWIEG